MNKQIIKSIIISVIIFGVAVSPAAAANYEKTIEAIQVTDVSQQAQIDQLNKNVFDLQGQVAKCQAGSTSQTFSGAMTPEMYELFAAFETRVSNLEKVVNTIQSVLTKIKNKIGLK